jgi:hypothetical protein
VSGECLSHKCPTAAGSALSPVTGVDAAFVLGECAAAAPGA